MKRMNWLDKLICAAVLILLAVLLNGKPKAAEPVWLTFTFPAGQGAISISDQPCTRPEVLERWENIRARVKAGSSVDIGLPKQSKLLWQGRVFAGCYVVGPDNGRVYNIDSTLEMLKPPIPLEMFVPHEGALPPRGKEV